MIKRQLQAGADRVRDDTVEAFQFLQALPRQLDGSGLWLAMAVMPEYLADDPPILTADRAQQFLRDWQLAAAPIEGFSFGGAMYPARRSHHDQPGVYREVPHRWRLALYDAGGPSGRGPRA